MEVVGRVRGSEIILGVNMGKAYSDERKLLMGILGKVDIKAKRILADALYGMKMCLKGSMRWRESTYGLR